MTEEKRGRPPDEADAPTRRQALIRLAAGSTAALLGGGVEAQAPAVAAPLTRAIPATGEAVPVVGLGTWITFNVGDDAVARNGCADVMRAFFDAGGRMVDSSPMYGSSQAVIGHGLARTSAGSRVFSADKVWVSPGARGPAQIEASRRLWNVPRFDLLQVHNLLAWQEHLPTLLAMKAAGKLRYVGITTSEGRRHREIEQIMAGQPIDFVQVSYNLLDREVEQRILPLARERAIAVIANRPFRQGDLLQELQRHRLPAWAAEIECDSWAQIALKFIVSHPAVTCAIPATTSVAHVRQNMGAARGRMPDAAMRQRMAAHVAAL
ncbi:MAG TPA: aldo/keto reductase [Caldimonas sp.]|jgi:diketogulonate reductase-like aldo/keto reductase|nr:aldo/keto reductase [Caldimonas sp.]HEX2541721.1 aldo/keto reductase [Caldimonas sp.]